MSVDKAVWTALFCGVSTCAPSQSAPAPASRSLPRCVSLPERFWGLNRARHFVAQRRSAETAGRLAFGVSRHYSVAPPLEDLAEKRAWLQGHSGATRVSRSVRSRVTNRVFLAPEIYVAFQGEAIIGNPSLTNCSTFPRAIPDLNPRPLDLRAHHHSNSHRGFEPRTSRPSVTTSYQKV